MKVYVYSASVIPEKGKEANKKGDPGDGVMGVTTDFESAVAAINDGWGTEGDVNWICQDDGDCGPLRLMYWSATITTSKPRLVIIARISSHLVDK